ncbi:hypothetical protein MP228_008144 [Amoeboaphelidium protococcarum]|nr:hypothetical protein MP228_008144 [Amoeboaphelidium protococcarum]
MILFLAILIQILALTFVCSGAGPDLNQDLPQTPPNAGDLVQSFVDRPEWEPTEDAMHYFQRVKVYCDQYQGHRLESTRFHVPPQYDVVDWCRVQSFKYKAFQLCLKYQYDNYDFQWLNTISLNWVKYNRLRYTSIEWDLEASFLKELQMLSQTLPEAELSQFELVIAGSEDLSDRDPKEFLVKGWRITLVMKFLDLKLDVKRMEGHRDVQLYIDDRSNSQKAVKRLQSSIKRRKLSTTMKVDRELKPSTDINLMDSFLEDGNFDFSLMESVKNVRQVHLFFNGQSFDLQQQESFVNKVKQFFGLFAENAAKGQITYFIGFESDSVDFSTSWNVLQVLLETASSVTPTIDVQFISQYRDSMIQMVPLQIGLIALGKLQPLSFVSPFSLWSLEDITMLTSALTRVLNYSRRTLRTSAPNSRLQNISQELIITKQGLWQYLMESKLSEMVQELHVPNYFEILALTYQPFALGEIPGVKQSVLLIGDAKDAWFLQSKIQSSPNGIPEAVDEASSLYSQTDVLESVRQEPPQNQFTQTMRQSLQWLRSQF